MGLSIEKINATDDEQIQALAQLDAAAYPSPDDLFDGEDWEFYRDIFQFFWMEIDGVKVGSLHLGVNMGAWDNEEDVPPQQDGSLYIVAIQIHPDYRGKIFPSMIQRWLVDFARANHLGKIAMICRKSNRSIITISRRMGFEFVKEVPDIWKNPDEPGLIFEFELAS